MPRRPNTNVPMTVLAVGFMVICMFGVGVVHFSANTPILQLRPLLEREYGTKGFETRFRPGQRPTVEIHVPAEALDDETTLDTVALFALQTYRDLAKRTRVRLLKARIKGDGDEDEAAVEWVEVTTTMVQHHERGVQALPVMEAMAKEKQVADPALTLTGVGRRGVRVELRGKVRLPRAVPRAEAITKELARELGQLSWVGVAQVELQTPDGKTHRAVSGPDAPR